MTTTIIPVRYLRRSLSRKILKAEHAKSLKAKTAKTNFQQGVRCGLQLAMHYTGLMDSDEAKRLYQEDEQVTV